MRAIRRGKLAHDPKIDSFLIQVRSKLHETRTYEAFAFETVRIRDGKFAEHWDQVTLAEGWMEPRSE